MDNDLDQEKTKSETEEYPETVEYDENGKFSDGEKQAKRGIAFLIISFVIPVLILLIVYTMAASIKEKGGRLDDSNAFGWVVGFFMFYPGVFLTLLFYTIGMSGLIKSESMYKKFLRVYPNENVSEKRKKLNSVCRVVKIIAILIPLLIIGSIVYNLRNILF